MIVNWGRLLRPFANPVGFVLGATLTGTALGLMGAAVIHFVVRPVSTFQFALIVGAFAAYGFFMSAVELAPVSIRMAIAKGFAGRPLTLREKLLWVLAIAVVVFGLFWGTPRAV